MPSKTRFFCHCCHQSDTWTKSIVGPAGRIGNWLTADQGWRLLAAFAGEDLRSKRDYAMIAVLLGRGLLRAEVAGLAVEHLQQREEHWVIADLIGKGGYVRTVPVPTWVKLAVDQWLTAAGVDPSDTSVQSLPEDGGREPPRANRHRLSRLHRNDRAR